MGEEKSFGELLEECFDYSICEEKNAYDNHMNMVEEEAIKEKTYNKNVNEYRRLTKLEKDEKITKRGIERLKALSKKIRKEKPFDKSLCIDMNNFVRDYLDYKFNATHWEHRELKKLESTYLIGVSNDFARENQGYVRKGYLLLVIDYKGNLATYVNPKLLEEYVNSEDYDKIIKGLRRVIVHDFKKIMELYDEFTLAFDRAELNRKFYNFLIEIKKDKKVEKIKRIKKVINKKGRL